MNDENTLWMGDIEPWMNETLIINSFKYFNIFPINVKLIKDKKKNLNKTYCFVIFKNREDANNALMNLNGNKLPSTNICFKLNWADYQTTSTKTAYVGNLNLNINDIELYKLFSAKYKSVHHANVITENGISKGYGFVTFKNEEDYLKSLKEMNGFNFHGNNIKVREKRKKDDDSNYNNGNNINNNSLILNKNKNNFYDFNKGKMNIGFLNNSNDNNINNVININNVPFIYPNNLNNSNNNTLIKDSEKRYNDVRNNNINNIHNNIFNNNLNHQINFLNNNNINNSLFNDINRINNSIDNKNNIINFNTIQNINIINGNEINNKINSYNNNSQSIEYLLNKINSNRNNNAFIYENNKTNNQQNISKINNIRYRKDNNISQNDNKNNFRSNELNNNMNNNRNNNTSINVNLKKEQINKIKSTSNMNYVYKKNINANHMINNNNDNKNSYKLEILENIDEITLCKKIHESIKRTFEYHKKMFMSNGIKFKSKFIYNYILYFI